jgi:hypothetical protein
VSWWRSTIRRRPADKAPRAWKWLHRAARVRPDQPVAEFPERVTRVAAWNLPRTATPSYDASPRAVATGGRQPLNVTDVPSPRFLSFQNWKQTVREQDRFAGYGHHSIRHLAASALCRPRVTGRPRKRPNLQNRCGNGSADYLLPLINTGDPWMSGEKCWGSGRRHVFAAVGSAVAQVSSDTAPKELDGKRMPEPPADRRAGPIRPGHGSCFKIRLPW